jgi:hypothetical protein
LICHRCQPSKADGRRLFERLAAASINQPYRLLMPVIGERVKPANTEQAFTRWWESVK